MYKIGIDLGGTNIATAVVNDKYEKSAREICRQTPPETRMKSQKIWRKQLIWRV